MRASCILTLLFLLARTAGAQQADSSPTSKPTAKSTFLVVYKPGPKWLTDRPLVSISTARSSCPCPAYMTAKPAAPRDAAPRRN